MVTSVFTHSAREWIPTKGEALEAMLATKEPNEKYSALIHPTTQEFIDFDVMGQSVESANLGAKKQQDKIFRLEKEEQENKTEQTRDGITASIAEMQEYREQKMREINGRHFSDADLEETINEIIDDKEAFQKKYNLTDEQADLALEHAMIMQGMTPDERDEYLKKLGQTEPDIANAIGKHSEEKLEARNNKSEISSTAKVADTKIVSNELDDLDAMLAEAEGSSFAESIMSDTQEVIKDSNIVKSAKLDNQLEPTTNNEAIPITPKGLEL